MGPPSFMQCVVDRNVVVRRVTVLQIKEWIKINCLTQDN